MYSTCMGCLRTVLVQSVRWQIYGRSAAASEQKMGTSIQMHFRSRTKNKNKMETSVQMSNMQQLEQPDRRTRTTSTCIPYTELKNLGLQVSKSGRDANGAGYYTAAEPSRFLFFLFNVVRSLNELSDVCAISENS